MSEVQKMIIRLIIGAAFFSVSFFVKNIVSDILIIISYLILGYDVLWKSIKNISKGHVFDENFLMSIASIGAFIIGEHPEAAAVMLFYQIGELFQNIAVNRSRKSITDLMDIRPDHANILINGKTKTVSPGQVHVGDYIVIKAGERVPLDGIVTDGNAFLDTSALTGESVPRKVIPGDDILSGAINTNGVLTVQVKKEYSDSAVSRILELTQNSIKQKAPSENFITQFARYYTPIVVSAAILLAIFPPLFTGYNFSTWIYRALIFLVVSCPCALVVSVPLGYFAGIGKESKNGILVKGSNYMDALTRIKTVIFDKTGTITKGVFTISEISTDMDTNEFMKIAAYAEYHSKHPVAIAIASAFKENIDETLITNYKELSGMGVSVDVNGKHILAGNSKLLDSYSINHPDVDSIGSIVYICADEKYLGYIIVSDIIKDDSFDAISSLKAAGIHIMMLSGDLKRTAESIGNKLNIDEIHAELLPNQKVEYLKKAISQKNDSNTVAFVGDGINDAPSLALADVGLAMGGLGADSAIEAADVVIMNDELSKIPCAIEIANKTRRIVWQNIIFAISVKIFIMILSAIGLSSMWLAIFADVGVALLAVANSLRALK